MPREEYIRAAVAVAASRLFPEIVRDAVIGDTKFTEAYGLKADAIIRFGRDDLTFQRSALFAAIRRALDPDGEAAGIDTTLGESWDVRVTVPKAPVEISLERGTARLLISHFALLSSEKEVRVGTLLREAENFCLRPEDTSRWENLLAERGPTDDEVVLIQDDLKNTPTAVATIIAENLAAGSVSLDVWVPRSPQYYERLVGRCEAGLTLDSYAGQVAPRQLDTLLQWRGAEGLKLALLMTPQPGLSVALGAADIADEVLADTLTWLADKGDPLSCAAAFEIALPRLKGSNRLRDQIANLARALVATGPVASVNPFELLAALFLTVYGEMAHCRIHADKPPFWRKLAALAQASLIARCIIDRGGDATELVRWLRSVRSQLYLLQCFADLREEPRWLPDFGLQRQLTNEICGRVWAAAARLEAEELDQELGDLLLREGDGSLAKRFSRSHAGLPGPLEGSMPPAAQLPAEEVERVKDQLSSPTIIIESVSGLANAAIVVGFPGELAEMAADAIARADYRLPHDNHANFVACLLGLASAAATARSAKLADAIFLLLRTYRQFHSDQLTIDDAFRIALVACASRSGLIEWCKCVGDFMTSCAFQPINTEEAARLHSHLIHLCHLVPELWSTCGQADAALRAVQMT